MALQINDCLTPGEKEFLRIMKCMKVVDNLPTNKKWTKNGGVKCACGDGHKDISRYHAAHVHPNTNLQMLAGGPLAYDLGFLAKKFKCFSRKELEVIRRSYVEDAKAYMGAKKTRVIFLTSHWPCVAAKAAEISFVDVMTANLPSIIGFFDTMCSREPELFRIESIYYKLHVKKINKLKRVEENTYLIDRGILLKNIDTLRRIRL